MKKRFIALLLCCVMIFTLSPSLIASAAADDETVQQVEQTSEAKDTDQQPEQQPDQAQNEDKNETQATEEPKTEEPMPEEPKIEEPKAEEPKAEEPKAEDETTIPAAEQSDAPVESEIITPTVNFTNVAPFLPPVSGGVRMLRAPLAARAAANFAANDAANDTATDNGMKISKTATANNDGSYTITLEAYATGEKVISEITKDVPTDIILVLDQSGSMAEDIGTVTFSQYEDEYNWYYGTTYHTRNQDYYEYRHNGGSGNLWHKLADGSFVSVSVTRQEKPSYTAITNGKNDSTSGKATSYWKNRNNLYALVDGEYLKVTVERTRSNGTYTYRLPDGTQIASQSGANQSPTFTGIEGNVIYLASVNDAATTYTYTYTDSNNNVQIIGTSTGATTVFSPALYERVTSTSGGGTRLDALKNAVNNFANAVHTKSLGKDGQVGGGDDIDHRIALVGFSSPDYNNTELLTGSAINQGDWKGTNISTGGWDGYYYFPTGYEMNGPQYGSISDAQYKAALLPMNTDAGLSGVATGVNALTAWGGTRTDNGLAMANKIFEQNPIPNGEKRNRVVIVFTDGIPGLSGYDGSVASSAITESNTAKTTYGATVYTIGIFSGADATSAGSTGNGSSDADKGNYFLQRVSSNKQYPQSPSYYLSAADSGSLNNIFQQISDQIETGGSSSTLTSDAVVKDIISPQFTLPKGATASDITLETYACTGKDGENYTWSKNTDAMGARATITSTDSTHETTTRNQVSVTDFDFAENYVGTVTENGQTTYRGNKLVITFKVKPRPGFLGGNDVITNTSAGVYENSSAENPVMTFDQPQVDVTIKEPDITLPDANVYLGAYFSETVNAEDLKNGTKVKFGDDIELNLTKPNENWGLESWQTEYVTIEVKVTDKYGKEVTDFEKLTEDTEYKVSVSIKPKTPKAGNSGYDESMAGTIHVFKPELTFKDSTAYYGESVPENNNYSGNYVANSEKWKNGGKYSTYDGVQMIGAKPKLDITYTPDEAKLDNGKYTKQDVPVSATVKIGTENVNGHTTFVHQDCTGKTCALPEGYHFWIHIQTCTLSITKQGGASDEPYVFTVYRNGKEYSEVTVWGNGTETLVELPIGTYTISENAGWSWRYTANNGSSAELTAQNPTGSITCVNTKNNNQWLNGFSEVVRNIFGTNH